MERPTEEFLKKEYPAAWKEMVDVHRYQPSDFKDKQVLDIGAHVGFVSLLALCFGARRIIAVEPDPTNFKILRENVAAYSEVIPLQCAAHGFAKAVSIIDRSSNCKVLPTESGVPAMRLEELTAMFDRDDNDMVMKMDTEGAEFDLLLCAPASVIRRYSMVMLETHLVPHLNNHPARQAGFLKTYMDFLGYKILNEEPLCWYANDGTVSTLEGMTSMRMSRINNIGM